MSTRGTRRLALAVGLLCAFMVSIAASEINETTRDDIRRILLETVHIGDAPKAVRLAAYAEARGLEAQNVDAVLLELAAAPRDSLEQDPLRHALSSAAIGVLGQRRSVQAAVGLREIARTGDPIRRRLAVRALVRIGTDLPGLAREVSTDTLRYGREDRFALYEELLVSLARGEYPGDSTEARALSTIVEEAAARESVPENRRLVDSLETEMRVMRGKN